MQGRYKSNKICAKEFNLHQALTLITRVHNECHIQRVQGDGVGALRCDAYNRRLKNKTCQATANIAKLQRFAQAKILEFHPA
jgi:hypothetical protein